MTKINKEVPNCSGCDNRSCKAIRKKGGYKYWYCFLGLLYDCNKKTHKKVTPIKRALIKAAREFLPEYEICNYGGITICDAPYGRYVWHFAVRMKQYKLWGLKEFHEGRAFGLNPSEPYRDANPHSEPERAHSWDCGYIMGLHEAEQQKEG